jgi:hypothetical protein
MRTPFGWTLTAQASLRILCAWCVLCGAPAAALAAPDQSTSTTAVTTMPPGAANPTANGAAAQVGRGSVDRRVLTLLAMGCLVGMIAGWARGGPREPRVRLLHKPKKTHLSVLVSPGPPPRLIPGDSPNARRARWSRAEVSRQTPIGATHPRVLHYIAPFADPADASDEARIDFLLEEEPLTDPADATTDSD